MEVFTTFLENGTTETDKNLLGRDLALYNLTSLKQF